MASIHIIVGSMLGGTEYIAEACEQVLNEHGHQITLHFQPVLDEIIAENQIWLVCTSTHGAGDYPDNIQPFVDQLTGSDLDLSTTQFLVIGSGDSNYDTFCKAAYSLENLLESKRCKKITPIFTIDVSQDLDPEEEAENWIKQVVDQL